ncbi:MAG: hypothetical protein HZA50_15090 [Planctomycetes bacterium]|nr:hypothetical protein [Planctomycetota bacterium]
MRKAAIILFAGVLLAALAGCEPGHTNKVVADPKLAPAERNYQAVWDAACQVLDDYYFQLDRQDRRAGVITTYPLTGKQWFEFWRKDAVTDDDGLENSLHAIYRVVKIRIAPTRDDETRFLAAVEVQVYRSNRPNPGESGFSEALSMLSVSKFSERRQPEGLPSGYLMDETGKAVIEKAYLTDLGRDRNLEQQLAARINASSPKFGQR